MPPVSTSTRERLLRSIARLERRLSSLRQAENRFSWYRLATFLLGAAAVWIFGAWLGASAGRLTFALAGLIFAALVWLHRRLDEAIARFEIWLEMRRTQLARLDLDWERLPLPSYSTTRSPLDLDLDLSGPRSLHQLLDLSASRQGSQRLLEWLTQPLSIPDEIAARQQLIAELAGLRRFRERLMLDLRLASKDLLNGDRLLKWLDAPYPRRRLVFQLAAGTLISAANLALFALNLAGVLPPYWAGTFVLGFIFYNFNVRAIQEFLAAVVELDAELDKFRPLLLRLERYPIGERPRLRRLLAPFRDPKEPPSALIRRIKGATAGIGLRSNPFLGILLNLILPWDYFFALLAGGLRQKAGRLLPIWLEAWYELDALLSLANFACLQPGYTFPRIQAGFTPIFAAQALGHPLIPAGQRITNDFAIQAAGQVLIVTGSNMAGKSTFLKTIGVTLCLAYAGAPVCARQLEAIPFRLQSCMRITDSLVDGWSYFYAEVKCLKALLDALAAPDGPPLFYLVDEMYRGTNNRERLIGSRAYLRVLIGQRGAGLIATHDLELANLAQDSPQALNYHFRDRVEDGRLAFDYKIHPGPCPTTNALRIMQMEGLPVESQHEDS